jgi:Bacterial protein of unknown function (DUF885)
MQDLADRAISDLDGEHFDVPEPARRIEAMIAPTSDGARVWLQARAEARDRAKDASSLKDFHSRALGPGPMGLDPLRQELARL